MNKYIRQILQIALIIGGNLFLLGVHNVYSAQVVLDTAGATTWDVPQGVSSITVKAWGGGGGGGGGGTNASGFGGDGGGAGFAQATLAVTELETLNVNVGGGGGQGDFSTGGSGSASGDGGGGGGRSGVARGVTQLLIAPGGGGGGGGDNSSATDGGDGGPGGGTTGTAGGASGTAPGGGGATAVAGGAGGNGTENDGSAGGSLAGGDGADGRTSAGADGSKANGGVTDGGDGGNGDQANAGFAGGGAGGSGLFGGGGGSCSIASNAGGGGGGGGSAVLTGTSTSTTAGSGTAAGNNLDADYANNAGQGGTGGLTSASGTDGNDGRIVISYTSADISGSSDLADGTLIKIAIDGVLFSSLEGTVTSNAWTIADVPIAGNEIITVWAEDGDGDIATADEATGVTQYDGTGDITGMVVNQHVLTIGSDDNSTLTLTEIGQYENSDDEDVLHLVTSGTVLIADGGSSYTDEEFRVLSGTTVDVGSVEGVRTHSFNLDGVLTIDGTMELTGDWDSTGGTLTANSGTVTFNGVVDQNITTATEAFYNVRLNNTGSAGDDDIILADALDVNGSLTIDDGDLDQGTNNVNINLFGNWIMGGSGSLTGGSGVATVVLDGTDQTISGSTTFRNLTKIENTDNGTDVNLTIEATTTQTITNTLNLAGLDDNDRLNLQSDSGGTRFTFDVTGGDQSVSYLDVTDSQASSNDITAVVSNSISGNDDGETTPFWIFADDRFWVGGAGANTNVSGNWSGSENSCGVGGGAGVPDSTQNAVFSNSCTNNATVDATFNVGGILIESGYTGTITPNAAIDIDVDGPLTMNDGTIDLSVNNTDINFSGNVTKTGGTFTAGNGTTLFDGILNLNVNSGTNLGDVTVGTSPDIAVTLASDIQVDSLTILSGDTLLTSGFEIDINGVLDLNGILNSSSGADGNTTINISGDWDMTSGTFTSANSTVQFDGTSIITSAGRAFNNFQIGSGATGATVTTADDLDLDGDLTVNNGGATTLNISNDTIFIGADLDFVNLDTFTTTSSTVQFNGTTRQTIASDTETYNTVEVTNVSAFGVDFTEGFTTTDLVSTTLSAKMQFQQSTTFTVSGSLNLVGEQNSEVELDSVDGATQFSLSVTGGDQIVEFVKVANSNAATNDITARNSVNDGGNDDLTATPFWIFPNPDGFGTQVYTVAGTDTFVVPKGVTEITVKIWGGGGGGAGGGSVGVGGDGGGGAFAQATLSVTPFETLNVHVGGGGGAGDFSSGAGGTIAGDGGGGAGRSLIARGASNLVIAGGGGGGGGGDNSSAVPGGDGGPGGGTTGLAGGNSTGVTGGGGGTQVAGGAAGTGGNNVGTAGASITGGLGADGRSGAGADGSKNNGGTTNGGDGGNGDEGANGYAAGGGGGAGLFGGGGGSGALASNAGGGGGGGGSSSVSGTSTSTADGSGTSAGNNTDTDYAGSAGQGGAGGALSSSGTAGNNGRIVINFIGAAVDLSGSSDLPDTTVVTLAVNGTICTGFTGSVSSGSWFINNAPIQSGEVITIWAEDGDGDIATADEATAITKYDGTGNITGMILNRHVVAIGSGDNQTFSLTDLNDYENGDDEDIMHIVTSGTVLIADGGGSYTDETLRILSNNTLTVGAIEGIRTHSFDLDGVLSTTGTLEVGGNWDATGGTFTVNTTTVTFNGSTDQNITAAAVPFYNMLINNTGGAGSDDIILQDDLDVNGTITITNGDLDANTNDVTINLAGNWSVGSLGSFDEGNSTIIFDAASGTSTVTMTADSFYNFEIDDSNGGGDYTVVSTGTLDMSGTFLLTDGALDLSVNNPFMYVGGNFTLSSGSFTPGVSTITFDGDKLFTDNIVTNVGTILIDPTTTLGTDMTCTSLTIDTGDTLVTDGYEIDCSRNMRVNGTLDATSGTDGNSTLNFGRNWRSHAGLLIMANSTVILDDDSGSDVLRPGDSNSFYNLYLDDSDGGSDITWELRSELHVDNDLRIVDGELDTRASQSNAIFVANDWFNSGEFTPNSSTVTFNGASTQTVTTCSSCTAGDFANIAVTNGSGSTVSFLGSFSTTNLTSTVGGAVLTFEAGSTVTISDTLNLNGQASGSRIVLDSSDGSTRFEFDVTGSDQSVSFVDVSNSESSTNDITAFNSVDNSNTDSAETTPQWIFDNGGPLRGAVIMVD